MHWSAGRGVIELERGDVTVAATDAIGNAANSMLAGGGGVDGAIHRAAGPELMEALLEVKKRLPGGMLRTGEAVMTPAFRLPARYVIHCVGPIYSREALRAPELLASCYRAALELCESHALASISFPSISTGVYGYPVKEAAPVALGAVAAHLEGAAAPRLCRFVLFDAATLDAYATAAADLFDSR
jgi:O-acetyl-ADP-ribose deacetylase (regulator of RNase III)